MRVALGCDGRPHQGDGSASAVQCSQRTTRESSEGVQPQACSALRVCGAAVCPTRVSEKGGCSKSLPTAGRMGPRRYPEVQSICLNQSACSPAGSTARFCSDSPPPKSREGNVVALKSIARRGSEDITAQWPRRCHSLSESEELLLSLSAP